MSEITWTDAELKEFDRLVDQNSSRLNGERIAGRLGLRKFVAEHGKEKCDAMWAHLEGRDKKNGK